MFLVKKKVKGPEKGDVVEVSTLSLDKINYPYRLVEQRIDTFDKFLLIDTFVIKNTKYARIINIKVNYSRSYNYKNLIKKKDYLLINYENLITSRSSLTDIFPEYDQQLFLEKAYGIK